jgi:hypothetical protein
MAQRPFSPEALKAHATSWLRPNVCNWSSVYRYTVLVPLEQVLDDGAVRFIATPDDLQNLELMLQEAFVEGIVMVERQEAMLLWRPPRQTAPRAITSPPARMRY